MDPQIDIMGIDAPHSLQVPPSNSAGAGNIEPRATSGSGLLDVDLNAPWIPWGKITRLADGVTKIHPLLDHMLDVSSVLGALLSLPAVRRALETAAGRTLRESDEARLQVLAVLHDVGKANTGFQARYWRERIERPRYWQVAECGHGPQGWALFSGCLHGAARVHSGLPLERMNDWGEAVLPLLHASISHHGRPVSADASESIGVCDALRRSGIGRHGKGKAIGTGPVLECSISRPFKTDSGRPRRSGCTAAATDTGPSEVALPSGRCTSVSSHPIDAALVLASND